MGARQTNRYLPTNDLGKQTLTGDCLAGCDSAWRLLRKPRLVVLLASLVVGEGPTMMLACTGVSLLRAIEEAPWMSEAGKPKAERQATNQVVL